MKSKSLLSPSQFSYRGLGTYDALLTFSHHLQVDLDRAMEGRLVHLNFPAEFDRVCHCGLLYKLRSLGVGKYYLSIISVSLVIEGSACVWTARSVRQLM